MSETLRRAVRVALLTALGAAVPSVGQVRAVRLAVEPAVRAAAAPSALAVGAASGAPAALAASPAAAALPSAPALPAAALPAAAVPAAPASPAAAAPRAVDSLRASAASGVLETSARFDGSRAASPAADAGFVVNDEGIRINDRAAVYYQEVRRMTDLYQTKFNLAESLDVMDDAYGEVVAKVSAVEAIAKGRGLSEENTHLEETLVWVDGLLTDGKKKVAVHTHRVFFHHAQNPKSEIAEGIRRVDGYIRDAEQLFARGGKAEQQMGKLNEVELVFDVRGYGEIKEHLKKVGTDVAERTHGRISFKYLDEVAPIPKEQAAVREKLNGFTRRYSGQSLSKIVEGVIYSRYVGLLLELKTLEHYHNLGYKVLQSGRELFDADGMYISELDAVVESPEGKVILVEAKSARVGLPFDEVLQDKVVYKLNTYKKFKAQLDAMIGRPFDEVVFAMDVAVNPDAGGKVTERDRAKLELVEFLRSKEASLSKRYGFPVSFLFIQSGPQGQGAQSRRR